MQLPPGRALELGCGTGTNTVWLAQHGFDCTGVDLSPRAIARARQRADEAGVQVNFLEADYTWVTHKLMELADRHANGRVVSVLEGGYDLEGLSKSVAAHVTALMRG